MTIVIQPNDIVKGSVLRATSNNIDHFFLNLHGQHLFQNPDRGSMGRGGGGHFAMRPQECNAGGI